MTDQNLETAETRPRRLVDLTELENLVLNGEGPDAGRLEWALEILRARDGAKAMSDENQARVIGGTGLPIHDARALMGGGTQVQIRLDDKVYTLMITRAGKLILTK